MPVENTITSIDIGSHKIRTVIWSFSEDNKSDFNVLWVWISSSNAIRKWNILDMEEFKNNLDKSLEEAEKMSWEQVSWVYVSFNSSSFEVNLSRWVIAISWNEVTAQDVDRVLDMAKNAINLSNREILKVIPEYFIVDLEEWVKNPVWMSARKLEVVANIFSINTNILNNIKKGISDVWIEIYDIYPNLISSSESVLSNRQKELWAVTIDIWSSITWITVYEEWALKYSWVIPMWWDNVKNDIALGLRTSIEVAEKLKLEYAKLDLENKKDYIDKDINMSDLWLSEEGSFSELYLSKIVTARYEEILYFVKQELKKIWKDWMLPEWAIFVWWAAKMKWFIELSKKELKLPSFIWVPSSTDDLNDTTINDPVFSWVIWTLILANRYLENRISFSINIMQIFDSIVKVFKKLLP